MNAGIAQIPLALGAGAASMIGQALSWTALRFARSPMASTGLVLISGLTLMAATNALFMQDTRHPAPMFVSGSASTPLPVSIEPVVVQPEAIPQRPNAAPSESAEAPAPALTTQSAVPVPTTPEPTVPAIGNQDIADLQEKLKALGFFDGAVDGYYGPRTADAIRDFEARFNLPRTGAATPQVIKAVKEAPLQTSQISQPVAATPQTDDIAPLLAQMQETAPTAADSVERQTVADISSDVTASTSQVVAADPSIPAVLDGDLVSDIQRGLSRLGFLQGSVNGVADEATARAIRQFQIFNNYRPTGEVSPVLRQMLVEAGAFL
ncbi:peptidoglycan-binding protein [Pelagibacterium sp.]|uniref:peptidoglycan-binding domain-containing protein n=1 Tax=Pelagibacterium sp. TaxID=1967288 RepID=UPI003A9055F0